MHPATQFIGYIGHKNESRREIMQSIISRRPPQWFFKRLTAKNFLQRIQQNGQPPVIWRITSTP